MATQPYLIEGGQYDFAVEPMYAMHRLAFGKRPKGRIPKVWSTSPTRSKQRPAFWMVQRSPKEYWCAEEVARFRSLKAAAAEAERLAREDKTLALLKGRPL